MVPIVTLIAILTIVPQLAILEIQLAILVQVNQLQLNPAQVQLLAHQNQQPLTTAVYKCVVIIYEGFGKVLGSIPFRELSKEKSCVLYGRN